MYGGSAKLLLLIAQRRGPGNPTLLKATSTQLFPLLVRFYLPGVHLQCTESVCPVLAECKLQVNSMYWIVSVVCSAGLEGYH